MDAEIANLRVQLHSSVSVSIKRLIEKLAKEEGVPMTVIIETAIREYAERRAKREKT